MVNHTKMDKKQTAMKTMLILMTLSICSCTWKHDGKILKDAQGNLYRLEANGIRNESYDLQPLPTSEIDTLINK
jgi:hypothetical protein